MTYKPLENTVNNYLNYCLLRQKNGYELTEDEESNTYDYYEEYCDTNNINKFTPVLFYRELARLGIKSKQVYIKGKGRIRKRLMDREILENILRVWKSDNIVHSSKLTIEGVDYQLVFKLIKIQKNSDITVEKDSDTVLENKE